MKDARLHRRLVIVLGGLALTAFSSGAGVEPLSAALAYLGLAVSFFWSPSPQVSERISRLWSPIAIVLTVRIAISALFIRDDVVVPVVDLLLLLLVAETIRPEESLNEARLYALTLALLLAGTAYRPGAIFGISFAAYIVLATVTVPMGLVRRKARILGGQPPAPDRRFVLTGVGLSLVTLLFSAVVFLTFPRVTQGWAGRGEVLASSIAGFSDRVSIGDVGARIYSNAEVVLRVEFPEGLPDNFLGLHWRGRSYDQFDGTQWRRSPSETIRPSRVTEDWYAERWPGSWIRQDIYAAPLDVRVLFGLSPVVRVEQESDIIPFQDLVGDWTYWGNTTPVYRAFSKTDNPPAELLRQANRGYMADRVRYLQLPRLPDRIAALADSITREFDNRYDKVTAIERYLRNEFTYTRELPRTVREATLDHFLFNRRAGHCEYFSTAMVVMLRSIGIHSRNVNGFLGGRWNEFGQYLAVTQNEAHSWVEVWFPTYGWVTFDPTPGGGTGEVARSGWDWPGRYWLDGFQHRWNKWILDYSVDIQIDAFQRMQDWLAEVAPGSEGQDRGPGAWLWVLLALPALVLGLRRARRGGPGKGPGPSRGSGVSRGYRALLRGARRAGVVGEGPVTPMALAHAIAHARPEVGELATRAVTTYTRVRFGNDTLSGADARDFRAELKAVVRSLRSGHSKGRRSFESGASGG